MQNKKQFIKKDTILLDTIFTLLPILTAKRKIEYMNINEQVNGFDYSFSGYNLDMDFDFKLLCLLIRLNKQSIEIDINDLLKEMNYTVKRIDTALKERLIKSIDNFFNAKISYKNKKREGNLRLLSFYEIDKENNKIQIELSKKLVEICKSTTNKMFFNYEDLEEKYGKKMIAKKLHIYIKSFSNNNKIDLKWDNILINLCINKDIESKKKVRKELKYMKNINEIYDYKDNKNGTLTVFLNRNKSQTTVNKVKKEKVKNAKLYDELDFL